MLFAGVIALGIGVLAQAGKRDVSTSLEIPSTATSVVEEISGAESDLPLWQINYENSYIHFSGDQAGAKFDGEWSAWIAELQFSPEPTASGVFNVTINTTEVNTNDKDRDDVLSDPEWFDSRAFPTAYYQAYSFTTNDDGSYAAQGQLIVKGLASPVVLNFTVEQQGDSRTLVGYAEFLRLDLAIGVGEWEDTSWVENEVRVDVRVEATLAN